MSPNVLQASSGDLHSGQIIFVTRILRLTTYLGGCCCDKSPGEAGFMYRLPQVFIALYIYSRIGTNICTKYHVSMLAESFKDRNGTSITAPDSFWVWNEKLIAFMPSEYQTDCLILTVVNSDCQATRTGFLNKPKMKKLRSQELSLELMLQSNLGSFAKPYFKIHITGSSLEKKRLVAQTLFIFLPHIY